MRRISRHSKPNSRRPGTTLAAVLLVSLACLGTFGGWTSAEAAAPGNRGRAALLAEVDSVVANLLAAGGGGAKSAGRPRALHVEGIAWESADGVRVGTSRIGLELEQALHRSLARRSVSLVPPAAIGSKAPGGEVLRGAFRVLKAGVSLSLSLVEPRTGRVISEARRLLSPASLGPSAGEGLLPPGSSSAEQLGRLIQRSLGASPSAFQLSVTTEQGSNAAMFAGDQVRVLVESERDCHLRLYHVSWREKTLTLIFPNRSESDGFLSAGTQRRIPDESKGVAFEVAPPYGVDAIIAVASETPFADEDWVASEIGSDGPEGTPIEGGDLARVGQYLVARGIDESRARDIFAKGLVVRHRANPDDPAAPVAPGTDESGAPDEAGATPTDDGSPPPEPARATSGLARSVCFYTTLPGIRGGQ